MRAAEIAAVRPLASIVPARQRCVPVDEAFADLFPEGGLKRGSVVGCGGEAAWSLAWALSARAVATGSWAAVVGVAGIGWEAVAEIGVPLVRVVQVETDRASWAERVAAAADGFELVITSPPPGAERMARRVRQRLHAKGSVMLAVASGAAAVACDLEVTAAVVGWAGIGHGSGRLMARRVSVEVAGRRAPRPMRRQMLLPGPTGRPQLLVERVGACVDDGDDRDGDAALAG